MIMKRIYIISVALIIGILVSPVIGQTENRTIEEIKPKKAWEIGIGGSAFKLTRFNLIDIYKNDKEGYNLNTQKKDVIFGGNIYVARELNSHFYLDFQGSLGYTRDQLRNKKEDRFLAMAGLGLQWRFGEYFESKYIDPYLRIGANYMYKNFNVVYNGLERYEEDEVKWEMDNLYNKENADKKHLIPISAGVGVNMWMNDRFGIGLQTDYLLMPYKNVANSLQGTVRLMWRFGGKSKKTKPQIEYVDREIIVERIVEKPVEVEKIVERVEYTTLYDLFNNIYFDFDKATLTSESEKVLDDIAKILKENTDKRFLITGYTDAVGAQEYNLDLSRRRASAVVNALVNRGVSSLMLKSIGVGKRISHIKASKGVKVREGDRKVTIEIIKNQDYWDSLPTQ